MQSCLDARLMRKAAGHLSVIQTRPAQTVSRDLRVHMSFLPMIALFILCHLMQTTGQAALCVEVMLLDGLSLVRLGCILTRRKGAAKRIAVRLLATSMSFRSTHNKSIQIHALQRLILLGKLIGRTSSNLLIL
ncbi:hypothetical protein HU200_059319 [Digitaria exilis]|uniref:Uncharacterized protein n=1 Tax=Digitaria exilis TaxID=1010633 RepID=A0A835E1L8_9POAL|nr:hypothetical protein HU200_059319 [Digitaria exilis]